MKRRPFVFALFALSTPLLDVQPRAIAADPPAAPTSVNTNRSIKRALDRPLPEVRFSGTSLSDCIDFLSDATQANIVVDWKALEAARITKDTPINLKLNGNVRLAKVLGLVLDQAAGAGVLTYYVDEGVLQITTQDAADKELITRLYPIGDLLFQAPDYNGAPNLSLQQQSSSAGGGGGGGSGNSQGVFGGGGATGDPNSAASNMTRQERADAIIKLITDTVRPEVWRVNGGNSTISFIRGNLVITAPRSVHEMLSSQP